MSAVLLLDIETLPGRAYVWSLWGENVPLGQLIDPSRVVCWAAKWADEKEMYFSSEWSHGRVPMLTEIHELFKLADAVITYNGDKFDLPKLYGEFLVEGFENPGPIASIDLYKTAKKMGFISNKLEFVSKHLSLGEKLKTGGFELWAGVDRGDAKAQARMEKYNKQDVRLLERLYKRVRPFIKSHPYLGDTPGTIGCPACDSKRVQRRGVRRTKAFLVERLHCQDCGSWSDGVRRKVQ